MTLCENLVDDKYSEFGENKWHDIFLPARIIEIGMRLMNNLKCTPLSDDGLENIDVSAMGFC